MLNSADTTSKMNWHMLYMLILFIGPCLSLELEEWKVSFLKHLGYPSRQDCKEHPPPEHSYVKCQENDDNRTCTYNCEDGYMFENGELSIQHTCDFEKGWKESVEVPRCITTCYPGCKNGGRCVEGKCVCVSGFRGNICQYSLEKCDPSLFASYAILTCKHYSNVSICDFKCPEQSEPEFLPEEFYVCNVTGNWNPLFPPQCLLYNSPIGNQFQKRNDKNVYVNLIKQIAIDIPYISKDIIQLKDKSVSSGVCATWGQFNYRTFDGLNFNFYGSCTYTLVEECKSKDFNIHVKNHFDCGNEGNCRIIYIVIDNKEFVVSKENEEIVIKRENKILPIPGRVDSLEFLESNNFLILESSYGFRLRWDGKETILLTVEPFLRNKTCGLCSQFDGIDANELIASNGKIVRSIVDFANSWQKVDDFEEECTTDSISNYVCQYKTKEERAKFLKSHDICKRIFNNPTFQNCGNYVKIGNYIQSCRHEYCACKTESEKCICSTLAEFLRECVRLGGTVSGNWRNGTNCTLECPEGMIPGQCDKSCPMTCQGSHYLCRDQTCIDWCRCPEGKVLDKTNGECVLQEECQCTYFDEVYAAGSLRKEDCNECVCVKGSWTCTKHACESRCVISGNKHYTTFDGRRYEFMGSCSYFLVFHKNFYIKQHKVKCNELVENLVWDNRASCTKSLEIKYKDTILVLKRFETYINKEEINIPYYNNHIKIDKLSHFIKVDIPDNITVLWDKNNRIYIDAMPNLYNQLKGLCGVFNGDYKDDLFSRFGEQESFVNKFAISWKDPTVECREEMLDLKTFCETDEKKMDLAKQRCSYINSDLFKDCHMFIDPDDYETECIEDMCSCIRDDCYCHAIANYAAACARKGRIIPWTESIPLCAPECYLRQTYSDCTNPCKYSCTSSAMESYVRKCENKCVQGCTCTDGNVLNLNGSCIPFSQCPCLINGIQHPLYDEFERNGLFCICTINGWYCEPTKSDVEYADAAEECDISENKIPNNKSDCQTNNLVFCVGGGSFPECENLKCRCKDGYLLDNKTKTCLPEKECARCKHYNVELKRTEEIDDLIICEKKKCNNKNLMEKKENITDCFKTCRIFGQNHIQMFNHKTFPIEEIECEKYLVKDDDFKISYKNHYCPKSTAICSVEVTLIAGNDTVITHDNQLIKKPETSNYFTIVKRGIWLLVYCSNDVVLAWDKKTRIYIYVINSRKMPKGLCSEIFSRINANLTDALKVDSDCESVVAKNETCNNEEMKKHSKCKILDSDLFKECKNIIGDAEYKNFKKMCMKDDCHCSYNENCNCFCTVIETVADICTTAGIVINWRNITFCPLDIDKNCTFITRSPACPPERTCLNNTVVDKLCRYLPLLEGKVEEPCPNDMIRMSVENRTCIHEWECKFCVINGKIFKENETVMFHTNETDACPCICIEKKMECNCPRYCKDGPGNWSYAVNRESTDLTDPDIVPCSLSYIYKSECINVSSNSSVQCKNSTAIRCFTHPDENEKFCHDINILFSCLCPTTSSSTISTTPSTSSSTISSTRSTSSSTISSTQQFIPTVTNISTSVTPLPPSANVTFSPTVTNISSTVTPVPPSECNRSLGLSELDVENILVNTGNEGINKSRGNIRLADDWPVFRYPTLGLLFFIIDLGEIYNITGMIIKGEEGNGTAALNWFKVYYSNHTDEGNMADYKNEKGELEKFKGTTKEENIRYQPLNPFLARYIRIRMKEKRDGLFGYVAIQIDILGCNITREEIPTNLTTELTTREETTVSPSNKTTTESTTTTEETTVSPSNKTTTESTTTTGSSSPVISSSSPIFSSTPPPPEHCKNISINENEVEVTISSGKHTFEDTYITWRADNRNEYQLIEIHFIEYQLFIKDIDTTESNVTYYALIYNYDKEKWKKFPTLINTKQIYELNQFMPAKYLKFLPIAYNESIDLQIKFSLCIDEGCPSVTDYKCEEYCRQQKLVCNGTSCVEPDSCRCIENNKIYEIGKIITENCLARQCINGKMIVISNTTSCVHRNCSSDEELIFNPNTCNCTCECKNGTIRCLKKDICGKRCDQIKDCEDGSDEECCPREPVPRPNCTTKEDVCEERNHTKCSFREKKIITFSKKVYICDTCTGYLIKERSENSFHIYFFRDCETEEFCEHIIVIKHDDLIFEIGPSLIIFLRSHGINLNRIEVSPSNSVINNEKGYKISMVVDTIQFISKKFGFIVTWKENNIVDIEVSSCLFDQIVGLCGYYTRDKIANENITEDGSCTNTPCTKWIAEGIRKEYCNYYHPYELNMTLTDIVQKSCDNISKLVDDECDVDLDLEKTHESFDSVKNVCPESIYKKCLSISECKCEALKHFYGYRFCDRKTEINLFRKYKCVTCPNGLEWNSCGIDQTCETIKIKSEENKERRVPGCFCPEGHVKIDDQCRPATDCTAKCNVYGDPNYRTFDNKDFRFRGNCDGTYVLLQTKPAEIDDPYIQIFGVNSRCNNLTNATCTVGVIVKYQGNILEVYANKSVVFDNKIVTCNYKDAYCPLGEISFKEFTELNLFQINITKHFVIISYKLLNTDQHSLRSLTVEIPTVQFYNKTEGLCGVYNDDDSDDFSLRNGVVVDDISTFVSDWIYGEKKNNCKISVPEYCKSNITECYFKSHDNCSLVDTTGFFKRHVESCQADFGCKHVSNPDLCKYKILYAEDCCQRHVQIRGWLQDESCHVPCKGNQTYRCVDICETKCPIDRNDQCEKGRIRKMACACPDGYVEKDDRCIKKEECDDCTAKPNSDIPAGFFNIDGCTNKNPILNRRQCVGECKAVSVYGIDGYYQRNCSCCTPSKFDKFDVSLYCKKNASTILFTIMEPVKCTCKLCNWHEYLYGDFNKTTNLYNDL